MIEIATTIGLSTLALFATIMAASWFLHGRRARPRERALFLSGFAYSGLLLAAVAGWQVAGIYVFLYASEFWRGVWVGGSAVFWLGYGPALAWVVSMGRRQTALARTLDAVR
jgi:hypothetical protein